jgi:PAS domain S-box-containing protein
LRYWSVRMSNVTNVKRETNGESGSPFPSELLYRATIDAMDSVIHVVGPDLRITLFNKAFSRWCHRLDIQGDQVIGRHILDLFPFLPDTVPDEYRQVFATGKMLITEETCLVNQRKIFTETQKIPISEGGSINRVITVVTDITQRKQAERLQSVLYRISEQTSSSRDLKELYQAIHHILGELIQINNLYIALYNKKTGFLSFPYFIDEKDPRPEPKKLGRGLTEYILRSGEPLLLKREKAAEFEKKHQIELIGTNCIDWLGIPLRDSENETFGVLVIQSYDEDIRYTETEKDILMFVSQQIATAIERKKTEKMLRETEAEFHKLQKIETIGTLVGSIAHDYNNILTTILGNAQLLDFTIPEQDEEAAKYVKAIIKAAENGAGLVRQLLSFTKNEETPVVPIDLNKILKDWDDMFTQIAGDNIRIVTHLAPELFPVRGNRGKVSQVIMNLVINATEAMPDGGTLTVETANVTLKESRSHQNVIVDPGAYVCLSVKDTGIGIEEGILHDIFKPFFTQKNNRKGTGLGLSIVKRVVEEMNGFAAVDSQVNHGTTMTIYIPRYESIESRFAESAEPPLIPGKGEVILLVEDHDAVRKLIKIFLKKHLGYSMLEATNGKEALEILQNNNVSLIITDIKMPEMDGITLLSEVQKKYPYLDQKVMAITAFSSDDDPALRQMGFVKVLQKPIRISTLSASIQEALNS